MLLLRLELLKEQQKVQNNALLELKESLEGNEKVCIVIIIVRKIIYSLAIS